MYKDETWTTKFSMSVEFALTFECCVRSKESYCTVRDEDNLSISVYRRRAPQDHVRFSDLITPSKATSAIAFAGNALKKHGRNPLQYPFNPASA